MLIKLKPNRGLAIISTLLAIGLLLSLLTAILGSQRARGDLTKFDKNHRLAEQAARSMLEYGRFKLEEEQQWLSEEPLRIVPPEDEDGRPIFEIDELSRDDVDEDHYIVTIEGKIFLPEAVAFELTLNNNFANTISADELLPHTGTLEIKTQLGSSSVHYLSTLRNAPFSNSTVAASGDIDIDTQNVVFKSNDPHRNQIRSKQNVMLPMVDSMEFEPGRAWQRGETGTVWAYGDILVGPEDDPLPLEEATEETGARFIPSGRQAYTVPSLAAEQVGADPEVDSISSFPPGEYQVGRKTLFFEDLDGATHERTVPMVLVNGGVIHFEEAALQEELPPIDLTTVRFGEDTERYPPVETRPLEENTMRIGPAEIFLSPEPTLPCEIRISANSKVVADGNLSISGTDTSDLPVLDFITDPTDPEPPRGHLEVKGGNLELACSLKNTGMLMASGDVNLQPSDVRVSADASKDVAVYAGNDVNIDPSIVTPSPGEIARGDKRLVFQGLVYAGGDFNFTADTGLRTRDGRRIDYNRRLEVIGGVVANGEMRMQGPHGADLTYDPEFLNDVMEKSIRGGSKKLEVISTLDL